MKKNRSTLKDYFRKGSIPTESNFADLIDSMINREEDGVDALPNDPLSVTAVGAEEGLLNFYRTEQNERKLSWQLKQKPGGKSGLSVGDGSAGRLFVESGTGKIGVGTVEPKQALDVRGRLNIENGVIQSGGDPITNTSDLGLYSRNDQRHIRIVSTNAPVRFFTDGGIGTNEALRIDANGDAIAGNLFLRRKRLGFSGSGSDVNHSIYNNGTNIDGEGAWDGIKMNVFQGMDVRVGDANGKQPASALRVEKGKVAVDGDLFLTGKLIPRGGPVSSENFEISLQGSATESTGGNTTFLKIGNMPVDMTAARGLNTVVLTSRGSFKDKANHDVYASAQGWNQWAAWVNGVAERGDIVAVATFDALNNAPRGGEAETLLVLAGAKEAFSAVKGSQRSPYALLFMIGGGAMEISNTYKGPNAKIDTSYYDFLMTALRGIAERRGPLHHRMYPASPMTYQNIFDAKKDGRISRLGTGAPYDETTYTDANPWNGWPIIKFGGNNDTDGNGAKIVIPDGYDTVWVRVLGERWNNLKAYFADGQNEQLGIWAGGYRSANSYSPDGSLTDGYQVAHQWLPIPAGRSGTLALISRPNTNSEFWLSGLAFSRNPWSHAAQSAVAFHWKSNGGDATFWDKDWHNWHNDVLSKIVQGGNNELIVPVVPSGRDKLLYIVEHNNDWNGCMHVGVTVNGVTVERLTSTYDNPFARHWNSKWYNRYIAARIPADLVPKDKRWMSVRIDMRKQDNGIHFREIGTHDMDTPFC